MKIIVDAFGGDNAPLEIIRGSRSAKNDFGVDIALVGDKEKIFPAPRRIRFRSTTLISSTHPTLSP